MGKFWCFLFGHKWRERVNNKYDIELLYYCARCGKATGKTKRI